MAAAMPGGLTKPAVGQRLPSIPADVCQAPFDFVVAPLDATDAPGFAVAHAYSARKATAERRMRACKGVYNFVPGTGSDLRFSSNLWSSCVLGAVSDWLVIDDATTDDGTATRGAPSELSVFCLSALRRQLQWGAHCSLFATILPAPYVNPVSGEAEVGNYSRHLRAYLQGYVTSQLWVKIPVAARLNEAESMPDATSRSSTVEKAGMAKEKATAKTEGANVETADSAVLGGETGHQEHAEEERPDGRTGKGKLIDGWDAWRVMQGMVNLHGQSTLGVALLLTYELPLDDDVMERWLAEPLRAVIIPTNVFSRCSKSQLALPAVYERFLKKAFEYRITVILEPDPATAASAFLPMVAYCDYVQRLFSSLPSATEATLFTAPYWDFLQVPMQPLRDNLESAAYETFERDPVKYKLYQRAIETALKDRLDAGKQRHVLTVAGAGRGPLVSACLSALSSVGILRETAKWTLYAVEKNVNANITLKSRVSDSRMKSADDPEHYWRCVKVVLSDVRSWQPEEKIDILVSELLGSFGDNELSPECIDGVQANLSDSGVSIPCSYQSFLEPISAPKLWSDLKRSTSPNAFASTYVCALHAYYPFSVEGASEVFSFEHPCPNLKEDGSHNNRYTMVRFTAKANAVMHGFAGYFHAQLYGDIAISIRPETFSENMISWFPLYVPIVQPVSVKKGDHVTLHIWRLQDSTKVWYEWGLTEPTALEIHNCEGAGASLLK